MDNYGTHRTAEVKPWLQKNPRFVVHFVPSSCSWLNLIERWFAELTNKRIRRGSFFSVNDLVAVIEEFLTAWNEKPKPFVWTATVDSILAKPNPGVDPTRLHLAQGSETKVELNTMS